MRVRRIWTSRGRRSRRTTIASRVAALLEPSRDFDAGNAPVSGADQAPDVDVERWTPGVELESELAGLAGPADRTAVRSPHRVVPGPRSPADPVTAGGPIGATAAQAGAAASPAGAVAPWERPGSSGLLGWLERRGLRVDPGRRTSLAMGMAAVLTAILAGGWVLLGRPHAAAVPPGEPVAAAPSRSAPPTSGGRSPGLVPSGSGPAGSPASGPPADGSLAVSRPVVVDVVGRVRRPGVYRLPTGSRVDDALRAAGGALPGVDLTALNLARPLSDGEQIAVGVRGAQPVSPPSSGPVPGAAGSAAAGPVDLNSATAGQLDALPGVGPVLAQHILDWRTAHGRFDSVDQLREVSGIGPSKFDTLRPLVTV